MKKNLKLASFALLATAAFSLVACGNKGGGTSSEQFNATYTEYSGKLKVSGPAAQAAWLKTVLNGYNAKRVEAGVSAIEFETLNIEEGDVESKVADWSVGPDVYAYASDKISPLFNKGALSPIKGEYKKFVQNTMSEGAYKAGYFANKLLAYPYAADNSYFLHYDATRLDVSKTGSIEELLAEAEAKGQKIAYPLETSFFSTGALFTYGARFNATYSDTGALEEVTADFNSEAGVRAGKAIYNIYKNPNFLNGDPAPTAENEVLATISGSWNVKSFSEAIEAAHGQYACVKMPTVTVDGKTSTLGSFLGYKLYGVNPLASADNAARFQVAHEVAQYLVSEEVQQMRFDNFKVAPTNKVVAAKDEVVNTPHIKAIQEQGESAVPQAATPAGLWSGAENLVKKIKAGTVTLDNIETAMKDMNDEVVASEG